MNATKKRRMILNQAGILGIACLAGDDVNRAEGRIWVTVEDGQLIDAAGGTRLTVEPGEGLMGWGDLDGPTYRITGDCGPGVNVPRSIIDGLNVAVA